MIFTEKVPRSEVELILPSLDLLSQHLHSGQRNILEVNSYVSDGLLLSVVNRLQHRLCVVRSKHLVDVVFTGYLFAARCTENEVLTCSQYRTEGCEELRLLQLLNHIQHDFICQLNSPVLSNLFYLTLAQGKLADLRFRNDMNG